MSAWDWLVQNGGNTVTLSQPEDRGNLSLSSILNQIKNSAPKSEQDIWGGINVDDPGGGFGTEGEVAAHGGPTPEGTAAFNSAFPGIMKAAAMASIPPLGGLKLGLTAANLIAKYGNDIWGGIKSLFGFGDESFTYSPPSDAELAALVASISNAGQYGIEGWGVDQSGNYNPASEMTSGFASAPSGGASPGGADPGGGYGSGGAMFGGGYM